MVGTRLFRDVLAAAAVTVLVVLLSAGAQAQNSPQPVNLTANDYDRSAASHAQNLKHHAWAANNENGRTSRPSQISNIHSASERADGGGGPEATVRFPADLQFHGGAVVQSVEQHLVYVNLTNNSGCTTVASCWGDPHGFLRDLGQSDMIHIMDQYTQSDQDGRYSVSNTPINVSYPTTPGTPLGDVDMVAIAHAVAKVYGTGYGNLYHIFLVPGQDECFSNPDGSLSNVCYSPDNFATFYFCAYHGSADTDIGHILYSVEPFQDVVGCSSRPNTPNGQLIDSTNNVLSHETFETLTDPDGSAWWNSLDNGLYGQEIGDECSFIAFTSTGVYFDPANVELNGRNYAIQPEENNRHHACTTQP